MPLPDPLQIRAGELLRLKLGFDGTATYRAEEFIEDPDAPQQWRRLRVIKQEGYSHDPGSPANDQFIIQAPVKGVRQLIVVDANVGLIVGDPGDVALRGELLRVEDNTQVDSQHDAYRVGADEVVLLRLRFHLEGR